MRISKIRLGTMLVLGLITFHPIQLTAQDDTPLDSLFRTEQLGFGQRLLLNPIRWWQGLSYSNTSLNCQFEKSCSNFMTEAILTKGPIRGTIIGTDRIVRCNPAARHYHIQRPGANIQIDGRLVEPFGWEPGYSPGKSPLLAAGLSIIPGAGRSYAGHAWDGLFSFIMVGAFGLNTYNHIQAERPLLAGINGAFTLLFWTADIYGAYRTAELAPPRNLHHP